MKRVLLVSLCACSTLLTCVPAWCQATPPHTPQGLLAEARKAAEKWDDYQVNGCTEESGKKRTFHLFFKKPDLVRIDARDGQVTLQPDGHVRGRLGRGVVGSISRGLKRNDKRLLDAEGIPFYESHLLAVYAHVEQQLKSGATGQVTSDATSYRLTIKSGDTVWEYVFEKDTLVPRENSRSVKGKVVESTHYTEFHPNSGLKDDHFRFG